MQSLTLTFAATVLRCEPEDRRMFAAKMAERCFRMGARLALEFNLPAVEMLESARTQLEREIPDAAEAIAEARAARAVLVAETTAELAGKLSGLLGKPTAG